MPATAVVLCLRSPGIGFAAGAQTFVRAFILIDTFRGNMHVDNAGRAVPVLCFKARNDYCECERAPSG